jgi:uncharacterized protein
MQAFWKGPLTVHSCIYEGKVRHRRFSPVQNEFRYRLFLMFLDFQELPTLFQNRWLWSANRFNLAYLRRRDHLGDPGIPLERAVRNLVQKETGLRPGGPIRLLTHFRYFGHCFNPVSFYFCYDQQDSFVETIVAEVHNTPWGEEHCYVLGEALNEHPRKDWKRYRFTKAFHVSPFMEMEILYDWRFRVPGQTLQVHFTNIMADGNRRFDATLSLKRREISGTALARVLPVYPFMTLKVLMMIYFQALRLLLKGATFYPHPSKKKSMVTP